jgi:hypothetical protein
MVKCCICNKAIGIYYDQNRKAYCNAHKKHMKMSLGESLYGKYEPSSPNMEINIDEWTKGMYGDFDGNQIPY